MKFFVYELIVGDVYFLVKNEIFYQREKKKVSLKFKVK